MTFNRFESQVGSYGVFWKLSYRPWSELTNGSGEQLLSSMFLTSVGYLMRSIALTDQL